MNATPADNHSGSADPLAMLRDLVRAESVTPDAAPALDVMEAWLAPSGFTISRPVFTEAGTPDVENLFAAIGNGTRHLTFAGHVDVVPAGDAALWSHPPFDADEDGGALYGRGAVDMKGGLAAMACAALRFLARRGPEFGGRISFLITGDEEGPAINGTAKLLDWAKANGEDFSAAIVGEPTSAERLGDQVKIGRRGSFSATLTVTGKQGHAAYPHMADNPVRGMTTLLDALLSEPLDTGSDHFEPSTFEVISVDVGNPAWNVIPGKAKARFNSRYNDLWTRESLEAEIAGRLKRAAGERRHRPDAERPIDWRLDLEPSPSDVFLTRDDVLIALVSGAIRKVTGEEPVLSTGGGTSDARFIKDYCPVVEFGLVGKTMHQVDERVAVADLETATRVYEAVLDAYFPA
jgi:succinyl-diaminopimelate desuccinylase